MQDRDVRQYCQEISDDFVKEYSQILDDNIFKMMEHFGYNREMNSADWLEDNGFDLLIDEDYVANEDIRRKTIFLANKKTGDIQALFIVEIKGGLEFRFSDVFVRGDF